MEIKTLAGTLIVISFVWKLPDFYIIQKSITCYQQFVIGHYLYPLIYHFMAHLLELECFSISRWNHEPKVKLNQIWITSGLSLIRLVCCEP
jgi:hypothetical protein